MSAAHEAIAVNVDAANPGQFFACCGLLEFAGRMHPDALGWFTENEFHISGAGTLESLVEAIVKSELIQTEKYNNTSSRIWVVPPKAARLDRWKDIWESIVQGDNKESERVKDRADGFLLDWWHEARSGGRELKVWAGKMESLRIAMAMQQALKHSTCRTSDLFDYGDVVFEPDNRGKKVEPFYFDSRRGPNAHSRDVGFAPNDLDLKSTAFPAVEFLCLVGLQRVLPKRVPGQPRTYEYTTWREPVPMELAPLFASHRVPPATLRGYRFENWYRTGQKKHKAFLPAVPVSLRDDR
ncbi:MAG TPA: type I-U CRISPR-associated protein Cas8c [Pirellulales bacterium]